MSWAKCQNTLTDVKFIGNMVHFECCKKRYNVQKNTMLERAHLSLRKFILLLYCFLVPHMPYERVQEEITNSDDEESDVESEGSYRKTPMTESTKNYFGS